MVELLKKEVSLPFDEAVEKAKIIVSQEFSILHIDSIDSIVKKKLNIDNDDWPIKCTIIQACSAPIAKLALETSLDIATLMPCSFTITQQGSKVFISHISIMKSAVELALVNNKDMKEVIQLTGEKVKKIWSQL